MKSQDPCLLCNESDLEILYNKDRNNKHVTNFICKNCGFVSIQPRPTIEKLSEYYKNGGFSIEARKNELPDNKKIKHSEKYAHDRIKFLNRMWPFKANWKGNVLEVGCGIGSFLYYLRALGGVPYGIEPDEGYAISGKKLYNIDISPLTLEEFDPKIKFDLISSFHVIEHVIDPNLFLAKIYDLLNPNGYIFIECPSITRIYGQKAKDFFWDVHLNSFSDNTLKSFLNKHGFEIMQKTEYRGFINYLARKTESKPQVKLIKDNVNGVKKNVKSYKKTLTNKIVRKSKTALAVNSIPELLVKSKNIIRKSLVEKKISYNRRLGFKGLSTSNLKVLHVGFHRSSNAGDIALFKCIENLLKSQNPSLSYTRHNLHQSVTDVDISYFNQFDIIIVGGGGLFIKDTNPNSVSGWQWPCPTEKYDEISAKILLFAVGFNKFRDQKEFGQTFTENIKALNSNSMQWGIRNTGSIEQLKNYLNPAESAKMVFQPCATTFISQYLKTSQDKRNQKKIGVNIAFDRHFLRYGSSEDKILKTLVKAIISIQELGYIVEIINHVNTDKKFNLWLQGQNVKLKNIDLFGKSLQTQIKAYENYDLVIGTRGHAQMIPFGVGTPILSLISHNKLKYFLDDINKPEWGVEVTDDNLENLIIDRVNNLDIKTENQEIINIQKRLFELTKENLKSVISGK